MVAGRGVDDAFGTAPRCGRQLGRAAADACRRASFSGACTACGRPPAHRGAQDGEPRAYKDSRREACAARLVRGKRWTRLLSYKGTLTPGHHSGVRRWSRVREDDPRPPLLFVCAPSLRRGRGTHAGRPRPSVSGGRRTRVEDHRTQRRGLQVASPWQVMVSGHPGLIAHRHANVVVPRRRATQKAKADLEQLASAMTPTSGERRAPA